jgi:hypothetical protein
MLQLSNLVRKISLLLEEVDEEMISFKIRIIGADIDALPPSQEKDEVEGLFVKAINVVRP